MARREAFQASLVVRREASLASLGHSLLLAALVIPLDHLQVTTALVTLEKGKEAPAPEKVPVRAKVEDLIMDQVAIMEAKRVATMDLDHLQVKAKVELTMDHLQAATMEAKRGVTMDLVLDLILLLVATMEAIMEAKRVEATEVAQAIQVARRLAMDTEGKTGFMCFTCQHYYFLTPIFSPFALFHFSHGYDGQPGYSPTPGGGYVGGKKGGAECSCGGSMQLVCEMGNTGNCHYACPQCEESLPPNCEESSNFCTVMMEGGVNTGTICKNYCVKEGAPAPHPGYSGKKGAYGYYYGTHPGPSSPGGQYGGSPGGSYGSGGKKGAYGYYNGTHPSPSGQYGGSPGGSYGYGGKKGNYAYGGYSGGKYGYVKLD